MCVFDFGNKNVFQKKKESEQFVSNMISNDQIEVIDD